MSYQVLARKWRPKKFQDVIGQKHITQSLQNAMTREQVGHAYLLCGTRGIGKTSIARLFAKALRCLNLTDDGNPCHKCDCCQDFETGTSMNIIEIDGASNNSVDNVRELISNIQYAPTIGKYKIYIIDEVHMLTNSAFNALLKTLEEPPSHVIFIMATTEPQKLLGTVLSRCQRFDFKNASVKDLVDHLKEIAKVEGIFFDSDKQIEHICREGQGSVRDTLSLLDQVLNYAPDRKINDIVLTFALGVASRGVLRELAQHLFAGRAKEISLLLENLVNQNVSIKKLSYGILDHIYEIIKNVDSPDQLIKFDLVSPEALEEISTAELFWIYEALAKDLSWALESIDPQRVIDICLQKVALRREFYSLGEVKKKIVDSQTESIAPISKAKLESETDQYQEMAVDLKKPSLTDVKEESLEYRDEELLINEKIFVPNHNNEDSSWDAFIEFVRGVSPPAATNLEQGNLLHPVSKKEEVVDVELVFGPDQKLFYDYLSEEENRKRMSGYVSDYYRIPADNVQLSFKLIDEQKKIEHGFMSKVEVREKHEEEVLNKKKNAFVSHPMILEAEKIFNAKIDKVILDKK